MLVQRSVNNAHYVYRVYEAYSATVKINYVNVYRFYGLLMLAVIEAAGEPVTCEL
jgi:hypothetical protein